MMVQPGQAYYEHDPYALKPAAPAPALQQPVSAVPSPVPSPVMHGSVLQCRVVAPAPPGPRPAGLSPQMSGMSCNSSMMGMQHSLSLDRMDSLPSLFATSGSSPPLDSRSPSALGGRITPQPSGISPQNVTMNAIPHIDIGSSGLPPPPAAPPAAPPALAQPARILLDVVAADFAVLVGKNAATLRGMREKCPGVTITIPRTNSPPGSKVALEGPLDRCLQAKVEVEAVLGTTVGGAYAHLPSPTPSTGTPTGGSPTCGGSVASTETCPLTRTASAPLGDSVLQQQHPNVKVKLPRKGGGSKELKRGLASLQPGHVMHPGDWECDVCGNMNWASRRHCNRCGKECVAKAGAGLQIINSGMRRIAGSCREGVSPADGELSGDAWAPDLAVAGGNWYCIDAGAARVISGVVVKAGAGGAFVSSFTLQHSLCGGEWTDFDGGAVLNGCADGESMHNVIFPKPINTRFVKLFPKAWCGAAPSLRCALVLAGEGEKAARAAARARLVAFYEAHNPSQLVFVDSVLNAHTDYPALFCKLESEYANPQQAALFKDPENDTFACLILLINTARQARVRISSETLSADSVKHFAHTHFRVPLAGLSVTSRYGHRPEENLAAFKADVARHKMIFCGATGVEDLDEDALPML